MSANRDLFNTLRAQSLLDLLDGPILQETPQPLPATATWSKVEGMLLGIAIGDALGLPTEGVRGWEYRSRYPTPLNYLPGENGPSDDTQLSFWALEVILRDSQFQPANVARTFADPKEHITGIGRIVRLFRENAKSRPSGPWWEWATRVPEPIRNGAVMRIAPIISPYLRSPSADLWIDAALCGRITHNSSVSTAACIALVNLMWQCLGMTAPPPAEWWADEFLRVFSQLCDRAVCPPESDPRPLLTGFNGQFADFVNGHVKRAFAAGRSVRDVCSPHGGGWGSGPHLFETLPSVLFVLMKHGNSFEEAVRVSVLDTRDNDTIAAIVGAILGALHGKGSIPDRWVSGLSGRTRQDDPGHVFCLIDRVKETFWDKVPAEPGDHS